MKRKTKYLIFYIALLGLNLTVGFIGGFTVWTGLAIGFASMGAIYSALDV